MKTTAVEIISADSMGAMGAIALTAKNLCGRRLHRSDATHHSTLIRLHNYKNIFNKTVTTDAILA